MIESKTAVLLSLFFAIGLSAWVSSAQAERIGAAGRVAAPDGTGLTGVRIGFHPVIAHGGDVVSLEAVTGADGAFSLKGAQPGLYQLSFEAGGYTRPFVFQSNTGYPFDTVLLHGETPPLVYELIPGERLAGAVRNGRGVPLSGASLAVIRERTPGGRFPQHKNVQNLAETSADEFGRFEFDTLRPGSVTLLVSHPDAAPLMTQPLETGRGDALIVLPEGRSVSGVARWENGDPAAGLRIECGTHNYAGRSIQDASAFTGYDGRFVFQHLSELPLTLNAWRGDALLAHQSIDGGEEDISGLVFSVTRGTALEPPDSEPANIFRARLVDGGFNPLPGVRIEVDGIGGTGGQTARTGPDGTFTVQTGPYGLDRIEASGVLDNPRRFIPPQILLGHGGMGMGPSFTRDPGTGEKVWLAPVPEFEIRRAGVDIPAIQIEAVPWGERFDTVSGVVTDYRGEPLDGAAVAALLTVDSPAAREAGAEPLMTTRADGEGRFSFEIPKGTDYLLEAQAIRAWRFVNDRVYAGPSAPGHPGGYRLTPAAASNLSGTVLLPSGEPARRFSIELRGEAWERANPFDDGFEFESENGEFTLYGLEPGAYTLKVSSPEGVAEHGPVALGEGGDLEGVTIELQMGRTVRGTVRSVWGPVEGATVAASLPGAFRYIQAFRGYTMSMDQREPARTDAEGRFELPGLPNAPVELRFHHPYCAAAKRVVNPAEFNEPVSVDLLEGGTLRGRAIDPAGRPIAKADITLRYEDWETFRRTETNEDGEFAFQHLPPGPCAVTCRPEGSWPPGANEETDGGRWTHSISRNLVVEDGGEHETVLRGGYSTLRGRVLWRGNPVAGATVSLDAPNGTATTADGEGFYDLERVPAGEKSVRASAELTDSAGRTFTGHGTADVEAEAGQAHEAEVHIRDTLIHGRVTDASTGEPIPHAQIQHERQMGGTLHTGRIECDAEGRYFIHSAGYGRHAMKIDELPGFADRIEIVEVSEDKPRVRVDFPMGRERGIFFGRVLAESSGEPVPNAYVCMIPAEVREPAPEWFRVHYARADETGRFEIGDIPPGKYAVHASPGAMAQGDAPLARTAALADIRGGETAELDIRLPGGTPIGMAFYAQGGRERLSFETHRNLRVSIQSAEGWTVPGGALLSNHADGVVSLAPGRYVVAASLGPDRRALVPVQIAEGDAPRYYEIVIP